MTLWTCWSIPVTSIDPFDDPKIHSNSSYPISDSQKTSGSHQDWLKKNILLQRIRHGSLTWSSCSLFLSLMIWFEQGIYSFDILIFLSFFLLIFSSAWSFFRVNEETSLQLLRGNHSKLTEQLRTQIDLDQNTEKDFNEEKTAKEKNSRIIFNQYFKEKHQLELLDTIQHSSPKTGWISALSFSLVLQGVLACFFIMEEEPAQGSHTLLNIEESAAESYRILFPAYLKLPPKQYQKMPGKLSTPMGSQLEMSWNKVPFSKESSYFKNLQKETPLQWFERGEQTLARFTPENSGILKLGWESREIPWKVIPDQKPILRVQWPEEIKHIFDSSQINIQVFAEDDHALHQVLLNYQVKKTEYRNKEILQSYEEKFKTYSENYEWDLSMTPLLAGDTVTVWVEASDHDFLNGPNLSVSKEFVFQLKSRSEYHKKIIARFEKVHLSMQDLMEKLDLQMVLETDLIESQIIPEMESLREDASHDLLLSDSLKAFPEEIERQLNYYRLQKQLLNKPECIQDKTITTNKKQYRKQLEQIETCLSN